MVIAHKVYGNAVPPAFQSEESKNRSSIRSDLARRNMIIDDIIQVLENYNLSIFDARDILLITSQKLLQRPVKSFS